MLENTPQLTAAEVKALLLAHFMASKAQQARVNALINTELGKSAAQDGESAKPEYAAFTEKFQNQIFGVIAERLVRNDRSVPLFSSEDVVEPCLAAILDEIVQTEGDNLDAKSRNLIERSMRASLENMMDLARSMMPLDKDPYDEQWRRLTVMLELAEERGVSPVELFNLEGATDEITRRLLTKEQFISQAKQNLNKLADIDALVVVVVRPMLAMFANGDEEAQRELEKEFKTETMPELKVLVDKCKAAINNFIDEEAARIYG